MTATCSMYVGRVKIDTKLLLLVLLYNASSGWCEYYNKKTHAFLTIIKINIMQVAAYELGWLS